LATLARGLWSGGVAAVVTASAAAQVESGGRLLAALHTARGAGADGIGAWCDVWREEIRRGGVRAAPNGIRLWCIKKKE
jgi:hypothetical protein